MQDLSIHGAGNILEVHSLALLILLGLKCFNCWRKLLLRQGKRDKKEKAEMLKLITN